MKGTLHIRFLVLKCASSRSQMNHNSLKFYQIFILSNKDLERGFFFGILAPTSVRPTFPKGSPSGSLVLMSLPYMYYGPCHDLSVFRAYDKVCLML